MVIILAIIVSVLVIVFLVELKKENRVAIADLVISKAWNKRFAKNDIEEKKAKFLFQQERYHTVSDKKAAKKIKEWDKQIADYQKAEEAYLSGRSLSVIDGITMFGYQLLTDLNVNAESDMFRKLMKSCEQSGYEELDKTQITGERKNSSIYAYYLIASLVSYAFVGVLVAFCLALLMLFVGNPASTALVVAVVGIVALLLAGYLPLDGLNARARKRQEAIDREFPDAISKIALLVTAGMTVLKAMEETANSDDNTICTELKRVMRDINQAATMEEALLHMQSRCSNKYLDKMVSVVSKSYVAGNANLADNLRSINAECWLEKKHSARRMGEAVQNKLFVPTMLMFIGILIVIIVPAMSSFGGF